jgi:hypothetical protein
MNPNTPIGTPNATVVVEQDDYATLVKTLNNATKAAVRANNAKTIVANVGNAVNTSTEAQVAAINKAVEAANQTVMANANIMSAQHQALNLHQALTGNAPKNAANLPETTSAIVAVLNQANSTHGTNLTEASVTVVPSETTPHETTATDVAATATGTATEATATTTETEEPVTGGAVSSGQQRRALIKLVRHLYLDKKQREKEHRRRRNYENDYYSNDYSDNYSSNSYYSSDRKRRQPENNYYYEEDLVENVFPEAPRNERREYSRLLRREGRRAADFLENEDLYGSSLLDASGVGASVSAINSSFAQTRQMERKFRQIQKLTMKAQGFRQKATLLRQQADQLDQQAALLEKQKLSLEQIAVTSPSATVRNAAQVGAAQLGATQQAVVAQANATRAAAAQARADATTVSAIPGPGAKVEVALPANSLIKAIQNLSAKLGNLDSTLNPNKKKGMSKNMEASFASQYAS